ncbi:hypothetical protein ACFE04_029742 [Oxalis oulophora]
MKVTKNSTFDGLPHTSEGSLPTLCVLQFLAKSCDGDGDGDGDGRKDRGKSHKINKRPSSTSALLKTVRGLESYIKVAKKETELLNEGTKSLANTLESAAHEKRELKHVLAQRKRALADQDALLKELEDYVVSFLASINNGVTVTSRDQWVVMFVQRRKNNDEIESCGSEVEDDLKPMTKSTRNEAANRGCRVDWSRYDTTKEAGATRSRNDADLFLASFIKQ